MIAADAVGAHPVEVVASELTVREALVRTRSLSVIRELLRREGIRVPSGTATAFLRRLQQVVVPPAQAAVVAPLAEGAWPRTSSLTH